MINEKYLATLSFSKLEDRLRLRKNQNLFCFSFDLHYLCKQNYKN
jgi:hypothetical protein